MSTHKNPTRSIIIHGGCSSFDLSSDLDCTILREQQLAMGPIINEGWELLSRGASALDVAERVVNLLELNPYFNAGIGGAIGQDEVVSLDASIMNGDTLQAGAVASIVGYPRAISVARCVMERTPHVLLVGEGAHEFADSLGLEKLDLSHFYTSYQRHLWNTYPAFTKSPAPPSKGTVGAVVRDALGTIVAATSTGGMTRKMKGRVGDSPIIGAGTYANSLIGGVSCTGYGEQILRTVLAKTVIDLVELRNLPIAQAMHEGLSKMQQLENGSGGLIAIDANGVIAYAGNESHMSRAYMSDSMATPVVEAALP
jgi:beta-aspartyl-peptidase (threonine type)